MLVKSAQSLGWEPRSGILFLTAFSVDSLCFEVNFSYGIVPRKDSIVNHGVTRLNRCTLLVLDLLLRQKKRPRIRKKKHNALLAVTNKQEVSLLCWIYFFSTEKK